jgi:ADP-L-glycero-D-manno-heptose 6-epimerase
MIALTGAGGFIGSVVLGYLNSQGINEVVIFDDLPFPDQYKNLIDKKYISIHSTEEMFEGENNVEAVIHIGANSSTLEKDWSSLYKTNVLSTRLWSRFCRENNIPFIFTSSAAVYGNGNGPLNPYAFSKVTSENEVDGVILRLFNVYGPNEYHKGRMASTPFHWFNQLAESSTINVFENSENYFRDFIYVEDVAKVIHFFLKNYQPGIYDVGTGSATSFDKLADYTLKNFDGGEKNYIPMPNDLKTQYQNSTRANTNKLKSAGFNVDLLKTSEIGISEYFKFLKDKKYY